MGGAAAVAAALEAGSSVTFRPLMTKSAQDVSSVNLTLIRPCVIVCPFSMGQYMWHLFLPSSNRLVSMTMISTFSCHSMCQKSSEVVVRGPCEAMKRRSTCTVGQNNQKYRRKYWATRSSVRSFTRTAHSFACSGLLASLAPSATLTHSLTCSLRSLPSSWESD